MAKEVTAKEVTAEETTVDEATVEGFTAPGWDGVRAAFDQAQRSDPGSAQLTVHHHSRLVVDLRTAGSGTSHGRRHPFSPGSVTALMSVTKGLVAVCAHLLSQRGQLALEAPVSQYWPQYASHGKESTTVADLLTHSAGVLSFSGGSTPMPLDDLLAWETCTARLADARPQWQPGSATLYHALTFGHLVGEVIRRATGRTVGEFFAAEVAQPLGLDLWIGLPAAEDHRFVPQHSPTGPVTEQQVKHVLAAMGIAREHPMAQALVTSTLELTAVTASLNTRQGRRAEIPSAGGIGNARSLSRLYASLIGPVDGIRLLSPMTVDRARAPRTDDLPAPVLLRHPEHSAPARFGLGFELPRTGLPMLGEGSFGHAGAGGRLGMAHPESGLAVGYTCTEMSWNGAEGADPRWLPWTAAVHEAAGLPVPGR